MKTTGKFTHIKGQAKEIKSQRTQGIPIMSFSVDGHFIQLTSRTPAIIDYNDDIEIAGYKEDGILNSVAYKNHTKNLNNLSDVKKAVWMGYIPSLIFLIIGVIMVYAIMSSFQIVVFILGVVFTIVGFMNIIKMHKFKKCVNILNKDIS